MKTYSASKKFKAFLEKNNYSKQDIMRLYYYILMLGNEYLQQELEVVLTDEDIKRLNGAENGEESKDLLGEIYQARTGKDISDLLQKIYEEIEQKIIKTPKMVKDMLQKASKELK